jgi:hypothetical protein
MSIYFFGFFSKLALGLGVLMCLLAVIFFVSLRFGISFENDNQFSLDPKHKVFLSFFSTFKLSLFIFGSGVLLIILSFSLKSIGREMIQSVTEVKDMFSN